jgi:predicted Rossmann fold nucleotide-binding protein DprA/Smf involved in DNA uptake
MRLAIVGSQSFPRGRATWTAERMVVNAIARHAPDVVISGGCPDGVDNMAENFAIDAGYFEEDGTLIVHRPKFQRWAPDGFQDRNFLIAQDCTHLLCIRSAASKTYGSGWTADRAEDIGKTVWRVLL